MTGRELKLDLSGMKRGRSERGRFLYLSVSILLSAVVIAAWLVADGISVRQYAELATENRGLQLGLAAAAMEEGFLRIIEENRILAGYSFPEYERGDRSDRSMETLFASELASYHESLAYSYFRTDGAAIFAAHRPQAAYASKALASSFPRAFGALEGGAELAVLPGGSDGAAPYFLAFFPVLAEGSLAGVLGAAVSFGPAVDKYLRGVSVQKGRSVLLLSESLGLRWPVGETGGAPAGNDTGDAVTVERRFSIGPASFMLRSVERREGFARELSAIEAPRTVALLGSVILLIFALVFGNRFYLERRLRKGVLDDEARLEEAMRRRERELFESELKYRTLIDAANDGVMLVDGSGRIHDCNPRVLSLLGADRAQVLGRSVEQFAPERQPDGRTSAEASAGFLATAISGMPAVFEWTMQAPSGRRIDVEVSLAPLVLNERRYAMSLIRDISQRKTAEARLKEMLEDRELLLRELHHRVKNNLQLMNSILALQKHSSTGEAEEAIAKVQSRLEALSTAYLALADTADTLRLDARGYLKAILDQVRTEHASQGKRLSVRIECPELRLPIEQAVPLGLILRELAANAASYACVEGEPCELSVHAELGERDFILSARDRGPGLPALAQEGLGLMIMKALAQQLHGILSLDDASPGLVARLSFPFKGYD